MDGYQDIRKSGCRISVDQGIGKSPSASGAVT